MYVCVCTHVFNTLKIQYVEFELKACFVPMYVYVCVCVRKHLLYLCMYAYAYPICEIQAEKHMFVSMYVHVCVCVRIRAWTPQSLIHTHTHTQIHMYAWPPGRS